MSTEKLSKEERINLLLNRKRKADVASTSTQDGESGEEAKTTVTPAKREKETTVTPAAKREKEDDVITSKAKAKLLLEAKLAKERADQMGPQGWLRPKSVHTNKNFLRRTLESAARSTKKQ